MFLLGRGVEKNAGEAFQRFSAALDAGVADATTLRDMAAEQLAKEALVKREVDEAAEQALKEAMRRERFPKPRLVKTDD
jgi:uncharacterized membrane protein